MKLTLTNKLGLITVAMISVVVAYSLCANLYMWSIHEGTHCIVNRSVPLAVAAEEMEVRKTAGR
ncbi:MAG: hypothetical protein ACYTAO_17450, partial [Planctomycetota bacterium]